jgi:hypothetical protein
MITNILILLYMHNELLHVSANHVAIFREVKYKDWIHHQVKVKPSRYRPGVAQRVPGS